MWNKIMADKLEVDLVATKSQLKYVNRNDWVLILDKAKYLNFKKDETLIEQGKATRDGLSDHEWQGADKE
jgi:hypothetical protein